MNLFIEFIATEQAMADVLRDVLVADGELRMQTRDLLPLPDKETWQLKVMLESLAAPPL
jgi:hypothetical protein